MKKLIWIAAVIGAAVLMAMAGVMFAEAEETRGVVMYAVCNPGSTVNVRERASSRAAATGYLELGDEVEALEEKKDNRGRTWTRIDSGQFEAEEAWVLSAYLTADKVEEIMDEWEVCAKGRVALRSAPDGKRIKWLKPGEKVWVFARAGEWIIVKGGYVKAEYLKEPEEAEE